VTSLNIIVFVLAKQKHKREIQKLAAEYEGSLKASNVKLATIKQQLAVAKEQVLKEKDKWQVKLDSMNDDIEKANDRVYQEKARRRASSPSPRANQRNSTSSNDIAKLCR
jgi:hypothetical protein